MLEHSGSKMARTIACFQWEGGYFAQLCTRVALHIVAGHAVGATRVPGALAPHGCLFRVHPHNRLLKNEVHFRAPRERVYKRSYSDKNGLGGAVVDFWYQICGLI